MPSAPLAMQGAQHMAQATPVAALLPASEVIINHLPLGKLTRQQAPLHARNYQVAQRVKNAPLANVARAPA